MIQNLPAGTILRRHKIQTRRALTEPCTHKQPLARVVSPGAIFPTNPSLNYPSTAASGIAPFRDAADDLGPGQVTKLYFESVLGAVVWEQD